MLCIAPERLSKNRRLVDRRSEGGFEKIEVAALVGLLDVVSEHPAIAALEPRFGLLPCGTAPGEFCLAHIELDGARRDVERDPVAILHQRQRTADIGFG